MPSEQYRKCNLGTLPKGVPWAKELKEITELPPKPCEDPSEFLKRNYQDFRHYTDADHEAPRNMRMANMIFIGQSTPDIRRKF